MNRPGQVTSSRSSASAPSFFQGAPWTKLACIAWTVGHVVYGRHSQLSSQSSFLEKALSSTLFTSTGELIMGLLWLAPHMRNLEREFGSQQFAVWWLWIGLGAFVWQFLGAPRVGEEGTYFSDHKTSLSLPYVYMGAILFWYLRFVPRLHPKFVGVLGINASEKVLQYAFVFYLVAYQGVWGFLQAGVGAVLSAFYFALVPRYLPLSIPQVIVKSIPWESLGSFLFLDPPPKVYVPWMMPMQAAGVGMRAPMGGAAGLGGGGGRMRRRHNPAAAAVPAAADTLPPPPPPPQEAVDQLTAMGFDEARVRQALQDSYNNVERAADRLLAG